MHLEVDVLSKHILDFKFSGRFRPHILYIYSIVLVSSIPIPQLLRPRTPAIALTAETTSVASAPRMKTFMIDGSTFTCSFGYASIQLYITDQMML